MKVIIAVGAALVLSGCVSIDRHPALPPALAKIPASLKAECKSVIDIPDRDLTQDEIASLWANDRKHLGICARRQGDLVKAINELEGQGK
ncbi:hypothetical protein EN759_00330 [Mesorhizobium sp. M00.F.Ca.ET.038.03.1.1]|nr:hypothetical protein EN759_00330 [Mesorhizobium sp. M00.F.Ca.ET.038.03.1.1]